MELPTRRPGPGLIVLVGPPAVGKMTVGLELQRLLGYRLLHNHMTIDVVLPFFEFGTEPFTRLVSSFRRQIVEAVVDSDLPGLVFTYVWAFDIPEDGAEIEQFADVFRDRGLPVMFVELQASQEERLRRNTTELRLDHKRPKRDLAWSEANLLELDAQYQLASPDEVQARPDWLRIDTTDLSPEATAARILEHFQLGRPT